jgi:hypothetical protein
MSGRRSGLLPCLRAWSFLLAAAGACHPLPAPAQTATPYVPNTDHRWTLLEDNDGMITHDDRHYTQGLRVSDLLPETDPGDNEEAIFNGIGLLLPMYRRGADSHRRIEWSPLGQSLFTPSDTQLNPPDRTDRPYAGWIYMGGALLQENRHGQHSADLNSLELLGGVVGKWALGRQVQSSFHRTFGFGNAYGWSEQLANRAALQLSYDRKQRLTVLTGDEFGIDAIPEAGASLGTVFREADAGLLLRAGGGLQTDYGPDRIRPAPSGSAYYNEQAIGASSVRGYCFAGIQQRWIWYNRFIDGSQELGPQGLERRDAVTDLIAGLSLLVGRDGRLDFTATRRSREFATQQNNDVFGSASFTVRL